MPKPMTDMEIYDALHQSLMPLLGQTGETPHGDTALKAAVKALSGLQIGVLLMAERKPLPRDPE